MLYVVCERFLGNILVNLKIYDCNFHFRSSSSVVGGLGNDILLNIGNVSCHEGIYLSTCQFDTLLHMCQDKNLPIDAHVSTQNLPVDQKNKNIRSPRPSSYPRRLLRKKKA